MNTTKRASHVKIFRSAGAFNQNVNGWATGAVKSMQDMFRDAGAFN